MTSSEGVHRKSVEISFERKPVSGSMTDEAMPPNNLDLPSEGEKIKKNIDALSKSEGCTCGNVANALKKGGMGVARVLAGLVGMPLYAAVTVVGGGLSLAVLIGTAAIAIPPALLGAVIGAGVGAIKGDASSGAQIGASVGAGIAINPGALIEVGLYAPKWLMLNTVGKLGSGLTAFAVTGKTEEQQLKGKDEQSTNAKLYDQLYNETFLNKILFTKLITDLQKSQ